MSDHDEEERELRFLRKVFKAGGDAVCPPLCLLEACARGELSLRERRMVESHAARCAFCREALQRSREPWEPSFQDIAGAGRLGWEQVRERLPLDLPAFDEERGDRPAARAAEVKERIPAYGPLPAPRRQASPRRLCLSLALVASVAAVVLLLAIFLMDSIGPIPSISRGGEAPRGTVVIDASAVKEGGSIEITHSPQWSPVATHPVDPGSSEVVMKLDPGMYWVRVVGEKTESQWTPVSVGLSGKSRVELKSPSLPPFFAPSPSPSIESRAAESEKECADIIEKVERSTVKIEITLPSGRQGVGTGFAVRHRGGIGIITSFHIVEGASRIQVSTSEQQRFDASPRASYRDADLVLLDIPEGINLPPVSLGDSRRLRKGEEVLVLGNPLNEDYSVSEGIVSKMKHTERGLRVILFSNKLNPGNSGSPLFLGNGEVVGIVSAKLCATAEIDSMGVSIASEEMEKWLNLGETIDPVQGASPPREPCRQQK
jgi:hypothetical protein